MSKFLTDVLGHVPGLSKYLTPASTSRPLTWASIVAGPRHALQRIVSRDPLHSKFIAFFVPEKLTLEYKGPEAEALRAEVHQEMAVAATHHLKPRFNRPSGPRP